MDRTTELELIDELLELKASKSPFLDENVAVSPVGHYLSDERFARERAAIFRKLPHSPAQSSELDGPGAFVRRDLRQLGRTDRRAAFREWVRRRGERRHRVEGASR